MATQAQLDAAYAWAKAQVGKPYVLGSFGSSFDCSTYMSGIATMIRDGEAKRWFTTHPFHSGAFSPLPGWERNLQSPFMIGITSDDIGHTGGTLLGMNFEATAADGRRVRMGPTARGAFHSMYEYRYGFRPALLLGGGTTPMPTIKLSETGPGKSVAANKVVQQALRNEYGTVVVDGDWGPQTSSYYKRWQQSVGNAALPWDGLPGRVSLPPLGKKYGFVVDLTAGSGTPTTPAPSTGEPAHNYTRTTYGGRTVNVRTQVMLKEAARLFGGPFALTQGSYNRGVSASAGTHDGGGVVDISVGGMTAARRSAAVQCLRRAGFAAWLRTPSQGFSYHIHACAIGDREMASAAKNQVQAYFNGRDGLARNGADTNPPRPWPAWANKYNF